MGIILDLIIIGIIILSTYLAYKKGLAALAIKLCAVIIAVVATLILYKPISIFIINATNIDETIQNAIIEQSYKAMNKNDNKDVTTSIIEKNATDAIKQTAKDLSEQIINLSVIVILYFGIKIALKFVTIIADKVAKLPILNQFNKVGGLVFGLLRGLVIVYAFLILVGFVGKVNSQNFIYRTVVESSLTRTMYENNVLNILL